MGKTAKGLLSYVKAQLGRPYWYGTFGQAANKALYNEKKKQHPSYYKWEYAGEIEKVHDCCGLIKGYLWCDSPEDLTPTYNEVQDISANMMRDDCKEKGEIATMPDVPGLLVFYDGHVGVYIGGGEVIEARGHKYGVVKTKLSARPWTAWGYCPFITYEEPEQEEVVVTKTITVELPVLKKGAKGDTVKVMQTLLMSKQYNLGGYGSDGSFGGATEKALKAYQEANGLEPDGSCGRKTWSKLLGVSTA